MTSDEKVQSIFRTLIGERAERLKGEVYLGDAVGRISSSLREDRMDDKSVLSSEEIGFHLMDWQAEAAFLVAVALFPERFTDEEIREGVAGVLMHAPQHILEAARQGGYPTDNIFTEED